MMHRLARFCLIAGLTFAVACGGTDIDDDTEEGDSSDNEPNVVVNDDANYDEYDKKFRDDLNAFNDRVFDNIDEEKDKKDKKEDDKKKKEDDKKDKKCLKKKCVEKKCVDKKCVDKKCVKYDDKGKCEKKKCVEKKCVDKKCVEKKCVKYADDKDKKCKELKKKCYNICKAKKYFWKKIDCQEYKYEKGDKGKKYYEICKINKKKWGDRDCKKFAKKCAKKKKDDKKIDPPLPPDPPPEDVLCPRTQGYWKNHNIYAEQDAQNIPWPTADFTADPAEDTILCEDLTWLEILHTPPQGDAFYILASQYIAARLNQAAAETLGVDLPEDMQSAIDEAADLIDVGEGEPCPSYPPGTENRDEITDLADTLADYNEMEPDQCVPWPGGME